MKYFFNRDLFTITKIESKYCRSVSTGAIAANVFQINLGGLSKLPVSIHIKGYLKINVY